MTSHTDTQREANTQDVLIVGGGIGGLVLALELHRLGIPCRVFEAAPELRPLGVGINVLPHAAKILGELGLEEELTSKSVLTESSVFYNRFGQFVHSAPNGRAAGYADPQYSIHRGELQLLLLRAVQERLGEDSVLLDHHCDTVEDSDGSITVNFSKTSDGSPLPSVQGSVAIGCDGVHSALRKQFYPDEGSLRYSGTMMWRGTTVAPPYLDGTSMARIGWLASGKMVLYPILNDVNDDGDQLINWVAELDGPYRNARDWSREGDSNDFAETFAEWKFDWIDIPALIAGSDSVLEYPMMDQEPLPRWTFGRATLLGDAAHPMVPRGSNGAGQAILDARSLAESLRDFDRVEALSRYEADRRPKASAVVLANRQSPPDAILRMVWERTGDQPFDQLEDVATAEEMNAVLTRYSEIAGFSQEQLR